jgi:hypothetical protein
MSRDVEANLKRASLTGSIVALLISVVHAYAPARSWAQGIKPSVTNQERVEKLRNKYSFQQLISGDPGAVANAKEIFALTNDPKIKQRAGSILLHIGKADQAQYDYLTGEAEKALDVANKMPWPTVYDNEGKIVDKINPEFLKWCAARKVDARDTFESAYFDAPMPWYFLASARDPRAHDLLVRGLRSPNVMIVVYAAEGLARLQASDALDEIIAAARHAPQETRYSIARALLFFPDSKAQAAAAESMNKADLDLWRKEIKSKGWRAFYDY